MKTIDSLMVERDAAEARVVELEASLARVLDWFVGSRDDHVLAVRPTRDYTAERHVLDAPAG